MTPLIQRAFELSQAQAKPAGQAAQAAAALLATVFDATADLAKSAVNGNVAFATAILSAKSLDAMVDIHHAFARDSVNATAAMASKLTDAGSVAAKECNALAIQQARTLAPSRAPTGA